MAKITINGISIDPNAQALNVRSISALADPESEYLLVQSGTGLNKNQRDEIENMGVKLVEYVPENTYIAHVKQNYNPDALNALPYVTAINPYFKGFKIARELLEIQVQSDNEVIANRGRVSPSSEFREIDIVLHDDADKEKAVSEIAKAVGVEAESLPKDKRKIRLKSQLSRLSRIADIDEVRHIEEVLTPKLFNDIARTILKVDTIQQPGSGGNPGNEEIVAVCDTGFDKGSTTDVHAAFQSRVVKLYDLGRTNRPNDPHGHGTHVAGSVLCQGNVSGYGPISGTAPEASLIMQSVLDDFGGLGGLPDDLNNLFEPTFLDGARVHNNSWGTTNSAGRYTTYSYEVDEFTWNHRDFLICIAAGNPGADRDRNGVVDFGSVEAPGTAKNCLTVGASENDRVDQSRQWGDPWPFDYPVAPLRDDLWADNPNGMAAFSGRGPTRDGRIKPDVVAPGTSILSSWSRDAAEDYFWGTSSDQNFGYMGGTSMATPLVSGCAAVVRQQLRNTHSIPDPSAALVKAVLINGAVDMFGQYSPSETSAIPNLSEGFGRVNLARSLGLQNTGNESLVVHDEQDELSSGETKTINFEVDPGIQLLKITLVWTDPPGEGLQNNLDLIVVASSGEVRHGNMAPGSTDFDDKNNVEQVEWGGFPAGSAQITVQASRIPFHAQSFALVVRTE